jgi:hypothetical protein
VGQSRGGLSTGNVLTHPLEPLGEVPKTHSRRNYGPREVETILPP